MLATPARLGPGGWPCHPIFHGGPLRLVGDAAGGSAMCRGGQGASARIIFRLRAERLRTRLHRSLLFLFLGECSPPLFFRGWGGTPPISKALRCGGGAALLLRKEWRAAKVRISFVVQRRCCPFSALELKRWRAANACELGPGGWPCHSILGWGAPMVFMGDVAGGSAIVPRREGGPAHTHNLSSPSRRIADTVPQEYSRREDAAQQGDVCEGYPRHASGRRGRRSLHPTLV